MKRFANALLVLPLSGLLVAAAQAEERVLHVYNWANYIAEDTVANFEKETGIKVVYDVFDSNETLETKLLAGHSGYDVVVPSSSFLARQIKAGVFRKLDKAQLPNWNHLDPALLKALDNADPHNQYAMPYLWGTAGIGYNVAKVKAALGVERIDSWDVLFQPANLEKLQSCGISLLDAPVDVFGEALHYLGLNPNPTDIADIQRAEQLLLRVRPYISYFHSSKYSTDLANGDICVAMGWSGDVFGARQRAEDAGNGVQIAYSIPREGASSFFDTMAIPADARHPAEAHAFLDYLMRPDVIAGVSNYVTYPNANRAATELVDERLRSNPGLYPDAQTVDKLYTFSELNPKVQRAMIRSWNRVKSAQ